MSVSHLEVTRRSPFAYDYERIDGKLHFAVDPGLAANSRIVDLDKAPRDAEGRGSLLGRLRASAACSTRTEGKSAAAVLRRESRPARRRAVQSLRTAPADPAADRRDRRGRRVPDAPRLDRGHVRLAVGHRAPARLDGPRGAPGARTPTTSPSRARSRSPFSPTKPTPTIVCRTGRCIRRRDASPMPTSRIPPADVDEPDGHSDRARLARRTSPRSCRASAGASPVKTTASRSPTTRTSGSTAASRPATGTK